MGLFDFLKKKDPNFTEGFANMQAGKFDEAIEYFAEVNPSSKEYDLAIAYIISSLNEVGRYKEGFVWFHKLPESSQYYQRAISDLLSILVNLDKFDDAFKWFAKATPRSNPFYGVSMINILAALVYADDYDKHDKNCDAVIRGFEQMSKFDQYYIRTFERLLEVLSEYHKYDSLLKYADEFLEMNPQDPTVIYYKGEALYELNQYEEALRYLNKIDCCEDDYMDAMYLKSLVYQKLGDEEEARKCLDEVYSIQYSSDSSAISTSGGMVERADHEKRTLRKKKAKA